MNLGENCPLMQRRCEFRRQILKAQTNPSSAHLTVLHDFIHDPARHIDRNGEADTDISAGGTDNGSVDPDKLTTKADQCPSRVARIDRRIRLNEILIAFDPQAATAQTRSRFPM